MPLLKAWVLPGLLVAFAAVIQDSVSKNEYTAPCRVELGVPKMGCLGEACDTRQLKHEATKDLVLRASVEAGSKTVGVVSKGQKVKRLEEWYVVRKPGRAKVVQTEESGPQIGDIVSVLHEDGEAFFTLCVGRSERIHSLGLEMIEEPDVRVGFLVETLDGTKGFTDRGFDLL